MISLCFPLCFNSQRRTLKMLYFLIDRSLETELRCFNHVEWHCELGLCMVLGAHAYSETRQQWSHSKQHGSIARNPSGLGALQFELRFSDYTFRNLLLSPHLYAPPHSVVRLSRGMDYSFRGWVFSCQATCHPACEEIHPVFPVLTGGESACPWLGLVLGPPFRCLSFSTRDLLLAGLLFCRTRWRCEVEVRGLPWSIRWKLTWEYKGGEGVGKPQERVKQGVLGDAARGRQKTLVGVRNVLLSLRAWVNIWSPASPWPMNAGLTFWQPPHHAAKIIGQKYI